MTSETDGLTIARWCIVREASARTGFLDLGRLGLTTLPEELFRLTHLRRLNLGQGITNGTGEWHCSASEFSPNKVHASLRALTMALPELEGLSVSGTDLASLDALGGFRCLQWLDCSATQIRDLGPIVALRALRALDCSDTKIVDLTPAAQLSALQELKCWWTPISDLKPVSELSALRTLDCSWTRINELNPVAGLNELQTLICSGTQIRELRPIAGLARLQTLKCSWTEINNLDPVTGLNRLQTLDCAGTQINDLGPAAVLNGLQILDCSGTQIGDLEPVSGLSKLQTLNCSGTKISDLHPIAKLSRLQALDCSNTKIVDLRPAAKLSALQELKCWWTAISDLGPVSELSSLRTLDCSWTHIKELNPVEGLNQLQMLNCSGTQITELMPIAGLARLQTLKCSWTEIEKIDPVKELRTLQTLDCSGTQVRDLGPLAELSALQTLDCSGTQIIDLAPIAGFIGLQTLDCSGTQISDLHPIAGLSGLQTLNCSETEISDLKPVTGLNELQTLSCSVTRIGDLGPVAHLGKLQSLDCSDVRLINIPDGLWQKPTLRRLTLHGAHVPGVPAEILSQSPGEDWLHSLRAHLDDLADGKAVVPDVKVMVLGNGRAGKTQICRRLRGQTYNEGILPAHHGIIVTSVQLPNSTGEKTAKLHIWDFGRQDVHHGTHALFMRATAVFLLAWSPERERLDEALYDGERFRDYPLGYWLQHVRQLGGLHSPILLIQTCCERPEDEAVPPLPNGALNEFRFRKVLQYSAKLDRGRAALDDALAQAVAWFAEQKGVVTIGASRLKLKRRFEELRDVDAGLPPEQRRHRTISQGQFQELCRQEGGITSPQHLLGYLHNAGVVFHRPGLSDDRIILDQSWALEAVYAVFQQERCYKQLRHSGGRFTRPLLEALVWGAYGVEEQRLFLSMMVSCGICFIHRRRRSEEEEDEYIAPDLLPERDKVQEELDARWDEQADTETVEFQYELLHAGVVRSVISRIGSQAGMTALYWKGGLSVFEKTTASRALLDHEMDNGWSGKIRVRTQSGHAVTLLNKLRALIAEESERVGSTPSITLIPSRHMTQVAADTVVAGTDRNGSSQIPSMTFVQEPSAKREYCVSYAWGDVTPEGAGREVIVDRLCAAAQQRGINVVRDKNVLGLGESISKFMQRIGRADRVFVVLSDKYLKSAFCMTELLEIWRFSRGEKPEFIDRVRAYTLPGVQISTLLDRLQYAVYWTQKKDSVDSLVKQYGSRVLGEDGMKEYFLMEDFAGRVSDILALVGDRLQPRSFEELEKHWLDDLRQ
jgi:internalin A